MTKPGLRISGWKSIAAFLGGDRTTVIRWAKERNLPVRKLPGGERATVYAFSHELEDWSRGQDWFIDEAQMGAILPETLALPVTPRLHDLFLRARSDWVRRDAASMQRAMADLQEITRIEPLFAPAQAALANCLVLAGEYSSHGYAESYPEARRRAEAALAIDPQLVAPHRALGSYYYFWDRDTKQAGDCFRQAIATSPDDVLTRIWYGNALTDNGEYVAARQQHDHARVHDAGPVPLSINQAWLFALAEDLDGGIAALHDLARAYPGNALIQDFLALTALIRGDPVAYLEHWKCCEELRGVSKEKSHAARLESAYLEGGASALVRTAIAQQTKAEEARPKPERAMAALFAHAAGDRMLLMEQLRLADAAVERWASGWIVLTLQKHWQADAEVIALFEDRLSPPMENRFISVQ